MKFKKTEINWAADLVAEAIVVKDVQARAELMMDLNDYFGEVLNAAPDANLAGQNTRELGVSSIGEGAPIDFAFMELFKEVDLRQSTSPIHEIVDVANGITFNQVEDGEEIKVRGVSSSNAFITALIYGAGLGFSDRWLRFNEFYKFEEAAQAAVRKYGANRANAHYGLFKSLGAGVDVAFDATIEKTIDTACADILEAVGDDYGLDDGTEFKILTNRRNAAAVNKALAAQFGNPNTNNNQVSSNVAPTLITSNANIEAIRATKPIAYVILPDHKIETPVWQDLMAEEGRNAARGGSDIFYRGEFNAAIGDIRQVRRIQLA